MLPNIVSSASTGSQDDLSINIFSEVNLSRLKYSPINPIGKKLLE
jgi:hypothetical protein